MAKVRDLNAKRHQCVLEVLEEYVKRTQLGTVESLALIAIDTDGEPVIDYVITDVGMFRTMIAALATLQFELLHQDFEMAEEPEKAP